MFPFLWWFLGYLFTFWRARVSAIPWRFFTIFLVGKFIYISGAKKIYGTKIWFLHLHTVFYRVGGQNKICLFVSVKHRIARDAIKKLASSFSKLRMNWANIRRNWRPKALKTARKWLKGGAVAGAKRRCLQVQDDRCSKSWSCYGRWNYCWCHCHCRRCRRLRFRLRVLNVERSDASI